MIEIAAPVPVAIDRLLTGNAIRFAERAHLEVIGDRGRPVRLPLVVAVPSGSLDSGKASDVWQRVLSARHNGVDGGDLDEELAIDCLLYPDAETRKLWISRWPRVLNQVAGLICQKIGLLDSGILGTPDAAEPDPEVLAEALKAHPAAAWYALRPGSERLYAVVEPPSLAAWRIFEQRRKTKGTRLHGLLSELVTAQVVAVVQETGGALVPMAPLLARFPGLVSVLGIAVRHLAGGATEAALGEF